MPYELDQLISELIDVVYNPYMRQYFPTLFCQENAENLRIIKTDGRIVSHIGVVVRDMIINGCRISVGNVGAVCTHADYRKRGYAWAILEDAMDKFSSEGVDMLLVSGFRTLYKHGCTHVGKVARYQISPSDNYPETGIELRPFCQEDLPEWAKLYRNEPVRFHRPYGDLKKLVTGIVVNNRRLLYSIYNKGGNIVAYAALGKIKSDDGEIHYIDEYAGSRYALLGAINKWCQEFESPLMGALVPQHDLVFQNLLDSTGAEIHYGNTGGTISILHFPRLCRKLKPMFEEIIGSDLADKLTFQMRNGSYIVGLDGQEVVIDNANDVARLVFGNPAGRDEKTVINAEGQLCKVLEAIFPVPRPEYGLSYI